MFTPNVLRRISTIVLFAFTSLTLQPLQAAVLEDGSTAPAAPDKSQRYGQSLEKIRDGLQVAKAKQEQGQSPDDDIALVRAQKAELDTLEADVEADFAAVGQHLRDHNLPAEIHARHEAALAEFHTKKNEFKQKFEAFEAAAAANDLEERKLKLKDLADYMQAQQPKPEHSPFDPNKIPFGSSHGNIRPPIESTAAYKNKLFKLKPVHLAANGSISGIVLPSADLPATPNDADLAETEDIQLTPAIKAQAQSLDNNPVKIHNWVSSNIEFIPTYGSIQGASQTLLTKRGNAFDIASLEIALLRTSGIPARYVYGTVQIPAEKVMNWVGGVNTPEAAQSLMSQGGIPNVGLASGGLIKYIKFEHVWVQAWVDYVPSRGAINKVGDTWISVDASFKQYQYTQGMDLQTNLPIDSNGVSTALKGGATVNENEGWFQNVNLTNLQALQANYENQTRQFVDGRNESATVGDVLGTKAISKQASPIFMGSLPYKTVAIGAVLQVLPENLKWKVGLKLYSTEMDRVNDVSSIEINKSLSSLAGKRLSLNYEPTTLSDRDTIQSYSDAGQTSFPAYLIRVTPTLKLESEVLARSGSYAIGSQHVFTVTMRSPWDMHERDYRLNVGDYSTLGINPAGIAPDIFVQRIGHESNQVQQIEDQISEMLYQVVLGWWTQKYVLEGLSGAYNQVVHYNMPSHAISAAPITVRYFFGVARSATYKTRSMDAKLDLLSIKHINGNSALEKQFMLSAGSVGSYLEGGIFEQMFQSNEPNGISTVSMLKAANEQGVRIYTINQNNINTVLPLIQTTASVKSDIASGVAAGLQVTIPQRDITSYGYTGIGYFIEDTQTGAGAYMIDGGKNGGSSPSQGGVLPPADPITGAPLAAGIALSLAQDAQFGALALRALVGLAMGPGILITGLVLLALVLVVAMIIIAAKTAAEEFKQEVKDKAAANAETKDWPIDNCVVTGVGLFPSPGWTQCIYQCKRTPSQRHPRFLPAEIGCVSPVPCAPGLYFTAPPRIVGTPFPPEATACVIAP